MIHRQFCVSNVTIILRDGERSNGFIARSEFLLKQPVIALAPELPIPK
jgi:hypothetical protein